MATFLLFIPTPTSKPLNAIKSQMFPFDSSFFKSNKFSQNNEARLDLILDFRHATQFLLLRSSEVIQLTPTNK